MNKKLFIWVFALLFLVSSFGFANTENLYCCERTTNGAWCQNAPENQCSNNFRKAPTSCEATSYCKLGTCVDVGEGICQENTPQRVCENEGGVWYDKQADELPQCNLGCCSLGDQAAFITQTRCKTLSSIQGLESIFRSDVDNEFECIASARPRVKGACVIDSEGQRDCKMLTKMECQNLEETSQDSEISFHEGYLCSADRLATNCGPRGGTTCVEGRDQVYFIDTCGNLANVYDHSRLNDQDYWTYIVGVEEACGFGESNVNSRVCGNCDYFSGSTCRNYRNARAPAPSYGNNICADLSCEYGGETYQHGEVWCEKNTGRNVPLGVPGSESFRLLCYNGEVTVEPCDPFRASICREIEIEDFTYAACVGNLWQDCFQQETQEDCENIDQRNCRWVPGYSILRDGEGRELNLENLMGEEVKASCVPEISPGFDFWNTETEATEICNVGSYYCNVKYEYGVFRDKDTIEERRDLQRKHCVENCKCIPGYKRGNSNKCEIGCESNEEFLRSVQGICGSAGDCGIEINYLGFDGYYDKYEIDFTEIE